MGKKIRTWLGHRPEGRVQVYYNLHKKCLSIRYKGKVIEHAREVTLTDAKFHVQPAGRERVLREKRKNVHAYISGTPTNVAFFDGEKSERITYNPYKYKSFISVETGDPVFKKDVVSIDGRHILGLTY